MSYTEMILRRENITLGDTKVGENVETASVRIVINSR
jgi:hypothetical protein